MQTAMPMSRCAAFTGKSLRVTQSQRAKVSLWVGQWWMGAVAGPRGCGGGRTGGEGGVLGVG